MADPKLVLSLCPMGVRDGAPDVAMAAPLFAKLWWQL